MRPPCVGLPLAFRLLVCLLACLGVSGVACLATVQAGDPACGRHEGAARTAAGAGGPCEPACKASWDEKKTTTPRYSLRCEHACGRDYDCWCNASPECRCRPPAGSVYVKKRLYKADGAETVEKVPKYEVTMVPAGPCDCARCTGVCWWNPLSVLRYLLGH